MGCVPAGPEGMCVGQMGPVLTAENEANSGSENKTNVRCLLVRLEEVGAPCLRGSSEASEETHGGQRWGWARGPETSLELGGLDHPGPEQASCTIRKLPGESSNPKRTNV